MTEAQPSRTDLQYAENLGDVLWLLVSTRSEVDEVRVWRIAGGEPVEEQMQVT